MIASVGADREGNSYNVNADRPPARSPRALGAYKVDLPDRRRRLAATTRPTRAADLPGDARRRSSGGSDGIEGGMRPKLEACVDGDRRRRPRRAHRRRARRRTRCCSSCSPTRASARRSRSRVMSLAELQALERRHVIADLRAPARSSSSAARARGCGTPTATSTSTSSPASRSTQLGHCHPARGRGGRRAGGAADARRQPLLHRARRCGSPSGCPQLARRQGVLLQLRRRGQRGRDQARAQGQRAGGDVVVVHGRASTAAPTARCRPRRRRPSRRRSRRWCPASSPSPPTTPTALAAAVDERTAAVLLEPIQGESGVHVLVRRAAARRARGLRRARRRADLRRDPVRHGAHRHAVGLRAGRRRARRR